MVDDFALTDSCYFVWSRAAVYTPLVGLPINCTVVVEIDAQIAPTDVDYGTHAELVYVRVKKAEVPSPERQATLEYDGETHTVEAFRHNGETEWWFDVSA